jgi:hypothetical protein
MARKTILNESEIRRFMKLANMAPVGEKRMDEMYPGARDEEMDVEVAPNLDTPEGDVAIEDEVALDEPVDDMALDEPMDDALPGDGLMVSVDDFMAAFETALEDVTGEDVSSEVDLGADEDMEGAEDLEGGDDALDGPEAEPDPAAGDEMDFAAAEEAPMQEELVNKVARRVAQRLVKENKKAQMTDEITERIFNRLTIKK